MAWGRLALIHAAGEGEQALQKTAAVFGYEATLDEDTSSIPASSTFETQETSPKENQSIVQIVRQPARFLRVKKLTHLSNAGHAQKPSYLNDPAMRLTAADSPPGTYSFDPPRRMLPMSRLLPFLLNSLGQPTNSSRLNHQKLAKQLSQGKAMQRLPYLVQQRWPQRLHIIVESTAALEPYWSDFEFIVNALKKLLGEEAVDAIRFENEHLSMENDYCIAWPTCSRDQWRRWQPPATDVSILILGDLGVSDPNGHALIHWKRFMRHLQAHPAPILTLSPAQQSPVNRQMCRLFKPNPLNDTQSLPRHPGRDGFTRQQVKPAKLQNILAQLSVLPVVDTGLLRRLRDDLQWGDSTLESVLWNHPEIRHTGLGIRLEERVIKIYKNRYQQLFAQKRKAKRLWSVVTKHHEKAFAGLKQLEELNRCVLENEQGEDMLRYMQGLCATLEQHDQDESQRKALELQCRTILASSPESIWESEYSDLGYQLYAFAHADDIRAGKWPEKLEKGFDLSKLEWMLDKKQRDQMVTWFVVQSGDQGQFTLLQQGKRDDVVSPVASFQAQAQIPPVLSLPSGEIVPLQNGMNIVAPKEELIELQSSQQQMQLEAIEKPSWAHAIHWNGRYLCASVVVAGTSHDFTWTKDQQQGDTFSWVNDDKSGVVQFDQIGLYFDLEFKGIIQRFRWIEPGTFWMGSPETEVERLDNEVLHQVTISKGFWLADTACTQALWQAVMGDNPARFQKDSNNPVERVSWNDVQMFAQNLNQSIAHLNMRLPTEAEWEYACRAGTETPFSFGGNMTPEQVNYNGNHPYAGGEKGLRRDETVVVKSLPVNPWGLYEMQGNIWEWCQDRHGKYPKDQVGDPQGPPSGAGRVFRGGSWFSNGRDVRSAMRFGHVPDRRVSDLGFRLALGHAEPRQERRNKEQGQSDSQHGQPLRDEAAGHAGRQVKEDNSLLGRLKKSFKRKR